jgi:cell division protein FtsX
VRLTSWRIVRREVIRNLRRNALAALSVTIAIGVGGALVGGVIEWWVLVDRAADAARHTQEILGVSSQLTARRVALLAATAAAELIALVTTYLSMGRRRSSEAAVFEALGAPCVYTWWPALIEGLTEGLCGGLVAAIIALAAGPWIAGGERSTLVGSYTSGCFTSPQEARLGLCGGRQHSLVGVHHLDLDPIHLATSQDLRVAGGLVVLGSFLGLLNTTPTLRRRTGRRREV